MAAISKILVLHPKTLNSCRSSSTTSLLLVAKAKKSFSWFLTYLSQPRLCKGISSPATNDPIESHPDQTDTKGKDPNKESIQLKTNWDPSNHQLSQLITWVSHLQISLPQGFQRFQGFQRRAFDVPHDPMRQFDLRWRLRRLFFDFLKQDESRPHRVFFQKNVLKGQLIPKKSFPIPSLFGLCFGLCLFWFFAFRFRFGFRNRHRLPGRLGFVPARLGRRTLGPRKSRSGEVENRKVS